MGVSTMWHEGIASRLRSRAAPVEVPGHPNAAALLFRTGPLHAAAPAPAPTDAPPPSCSPCVVLYHGGGNDRIFGFGYVIERLLDSGFCVLTGHLSGHGAGGSDLFTLDNVRSRVDALLTLARCLVEERSGEVVVLGQSLGGSFALDQWLRGVRADRLVTVSAPTAIPRHMELLREAGCLLGTAAWRAMLYGGPLKALPAYRGFRRDDFPVRVPPGLHYVKAFAAAVESLDLVRRVASEGPRDGSCPLLLVHGVRDGVIPVSQAQDLAAALSNRATVRLLPRLHHLDPLLDRETVTAIVQWMRAT